MIYGGTGNDAIDAGGGTSAQYQYLYGSIGDDTYVYSKENVYVYIGATSEGGATGAADRIKFADLSLKDVTLSNYLYTGDLRSGRQRAQLHLERRRARPASCGSRSGASTSSASSSPTERRCPASRYHAASGRPTLIGTAGNDTINGINGADIIYGGLGQRRDERRRSGASALYQYLYGVGGDDTYVYSQRERLRLHRRDVRNVASGAADRIRFADLSLKDMTLSNYLYTGASAAEGNALNFTWSEGAQTGQLRIALGGQHIERFEFADGTTLSGDQPTTRRAVRGVDRHCRQRHHQWQRRRGIVYGGLATTCSNAGAGAAPAGSISMAQAATIPMSTPREKFTLYWLGVGGKRPRAARRTGSSSRTCRSTDHDALATYVYGDGTGTGSPRQRAADCIWNGGGHQRSSSVSPSSGPDIERFEFADGTTLSAIQHHAANGQASLIGTASNDYILAAPATT